MGRDILSVRQMMVLLLVALLAPVTDLLPSVVARQVGRGGWLAAPLVLPMLLFALWLCSKVFCDHDLCVQVGKPVGYTIIIIYLVWIVFVLSLVFCFSAARMEMIYRRVPPAFFAVGVAAVAAWMGRGKAAALARGAEVCYLALAVVLAGVLLMALFRAEWRNLYPVEWSSIPGGSMSIAGVLLNVVPVAVLGIRVPKETRRKGRVLGWAVAFCVVIALVLIAVLGTVGSRLCARLDTPYLIMVQGLGVKGAFQRLEAPVAAIWLLSDLILSGALLRAGNDYMTVLVSERWGRRIVPAIALAAVVIGWLLFLNDKTFRAFSVEILPATGIALGLIIPLLLQLISCIRKRK